MALRRFSLSHHNGILRSFVGIPWRVVPFPQFELQAKWISRVLSGRATLPPEEEMERSIASFYADLVARGLPVRYTHYQGDDQWKYNDAIASFCGEDVRSTAPWRLKMYKATGE